MVDRTRNTAIPRVDPDGKTVSIDNDVVVLDRNRFPYSQCIFSLVDLPYGSVKRMDAPSNPSGPVRRYVRWVKPIGAFDSETAHRISQSLFASKRYVSLPQHSSMPEDSPAYEYGDGDGRPLPPWIAFPTVRKYSIGWRMGRPESYVDEWNEWYRQALPATRAGYRTKYRPPFPMWTGWYLCRSSRSWLAYAGIITDSLRFICLVLLGLAFRPILWIYGRTQTRNPNGIAVINGRAPKPANGLDQIIAVTRGHGDGDNTIRNVEHPD